MISVNIIHKESRQNWIEERCKELEKNITKSDFIKVHKKIKEVTERKNGSY